ncbi:MAG: hypothetical protein AAGI49_13480 [Bacteroidota bacterium]
MKYISPLCSLATAQATNANQATQLPDTQISGVYEVMLGVVEETYAIKYFKEFGFRVIDRVEFTAKEAEALYGVPSALKSIRMQNGDIDSHGLLRVLVWEQPLGSGVGYTTPETIGQRMAVMRTKDIFRLVDVYKAARAGKEKWLITEPVADDLFGLDGKEKDFFSRPVIVRENAVYGEFFNHIFFQRYGYHIPGYGTIGAHSTLKTSEFTHHDFIVKGDINELNYLQTALGIQSEEPPVLDGDWMEGPRRVFQMNPGDNHWYWGFVSPNNICGKLKFFVPIGLKTDRSKNQRVGELGITLHSFYTPKLDFVYELVQKDNKLVSTSIQNNEFGERCFVFKGPLGCSWQIIEKKGTEHQPEQELKFELVKE